MTNKLALIKKTQKHTKKKPNLNQQATGSSPPVRTTHMSVQCIQLGTIVDTDVVKAGVVVYFAA